MAEYNYSALGERDFRILSLSPGKFNEPLKGELIVRAVDPYVDEASKHDGEIPETADSYEAVSYVWGSNDTPRSITLSSTEVSITENLYNCLRRVRLEDRPRNVWADALCINQADKAEKQAQVMLVHDIYVGSRRTLAYLGEEADGSKEAMELIEKYWRVNIPNPLNAGARAFLEDLQGEPVPDAPTGAEAELPAEGDEKWLAVSRFWNRAWFKRVWIVQEFILARDVLMICGDKTVNWAQLWPATIALEEPESPPWPLIDEKGDEVESAADLMANMAQRLRFYQLGAMRGNDREHGHGDDGHDHGHEHGGGCCGGAHGHDDDDEEVEEVEDGEDGEDGEWESEDEGEDPKRSTELLSLLLSFREVEATDPRDFYFALLGLAADGDRPEFRPDYSETFEETALRFGRTLLHEPFSEELLDHAGIAEHLNGADNKVPSWLPDFRRPWRRMTVADAAESEAAGETDFDFGFDPNEAEDELLLKGVKVDTIAQMSGIPRAAHLHADRPSMWVKKDLVTLSKLIEKIPGFEKATYPTGESSLEAILRTLTFFQTEADEEEVPMATLKLAYRFCTAVEDDDLDPERSERDVLRREIELSGRSAEDANEALVAAGQILINRIFTTRSALDLVLAKGEKYVSMVPDGCEAGDEIWVIKGCNAPFVLRKSAEREGLRRIVGTAYVHGIMEGEAVEEDVEFEPISIH
ncbi:ankyrin and het domain protein [Colletotrichum truncatum]|uniref:Ankyrin and het domain protein n=1 Tax=Colletotrichum truncatum TaxID=5467 RepID=A0ACC3YGJ3_COLTU|nr:ankyrin and het domain protein [Colletotrichum truncatum]KAF6788216.1 ankyrin and het domain protein [Colletotrichum truncatum]